MTSREKTLRPAIVIVALLMAPLGSAIAIILLFATGRWADGQGFAIYLGDGGWAAPVAFLFLVVGGPMIAVFWKRAPFGLISCSVMGAAYGALAFYFIALGLSDPDGIAAFEEEGRLFEYYVGHAQVVLLGSLAGLAGGLTFWQICRLGLQSRNDG